MPGLLGLSSAIYRLYTVADSRSMIKQRGTEAASKILDMIQPLRDVVYISIDYMVTSTTKCVCNVSLSANTRIA